MSGKPAARIGDTVICPALGQSAVVSGIFTRAIVVDSWLFPLAKRNRPRD
ncbi:MAG: hypothetical protein Q8P85_07940 [Pseudomonas sp.]|nr:hypothetical protein [Pseudomonas sp.]